MNEDQFQKRKIHSEIKFNLKKIIQKWNSNEIRCSLARISSHLINAKNQGDTREIDQL